MSFSDTTMRNRAKTCETTRLMLNCAGWLIQRSTTLDHEVKDSCQSQMLNLSDTYMVLWKRELTEEERRSVLARTDAVLKTISWNRWSNLPNLRRDPFGDHHVLVSGHLIDMAVQNSGIHDLYDEVRE